MGSIPRAPLINHSSGRFAAYNGDGLRMSKTANSSTSQFLWDLASALPRLLKDGSTAYVYAPGGLPLEQVTGSTVLWLHHDQLGGTRLVTNSSGSSQATYTFDAYGNLTASTGTITNPIRFAGEYWDAESGLYYLRARYFDAATGKFLTRDPMLGVTRQPYTYVKDNPLNKTDPSGLCDWWNVACGAQALAKAAHHVDIAQVASAVSAATSTAAFVAGAVGLEPAAAVLESVSVASTAVTVGADVLEGKDSRTIALDSLGFLAGAGALAGTAKAIRGGRRVTGALSHIVEGLSEAPLSRLRRTILGEVLAADAEASALRSVAGLFDVTATGLSLDLVLGTSPLASGAGCR